MTPEELLSHFNTIVKSHKRLTAEQKEQLSSGSTVTIYSGNEHQWTSKLEIIPKQNSYQGVMHINERLPARMHEQLLAQQKQFLAITQSL
jgi:hypothetical protein